MPTDIRKTGALNYRALQQQNDEKFNSQVLSDDDLMRMAVGIGKNLGSFTPEATTDVGLQAAQAGYGESQYDDAVSTQSQLENLGEVRYNEQPWYDVLANGVGKMFGRAGTTFVSSLIGLPYGLFQAANQGRASALWNNDVTQGLANVDKWFEENLENYQSQEQQQDPHFRFGDMNWWADNVISNAGFTLGAAASMAVGSGALGLMGRSLGLVNNIGKTTRGATNLLSALFSATGEGMIEARQGVEERNKLEMQRLEDSFAPEMQALELEFGEIESEYESNRGKNLVRGADGRMYDPAYETYRQRMADLSEKRDILNQRLEAGRQQIEESGRQMGNKILLANQGLLTMGNLIQFSKGMVKSFDKARHAAETSSKAVKPFGVTAEKMADGTYKIAGKNLGRTVAATKGILTEGSEEMNQQMIQASSGAAYNEQDVNDYWKAKLDPDSYRETTKGLYTMGNILDRGFQESWGDVDQWEQFVIGGLTGMTGSYTPTKLFNQDKSKSIWNPMRYGSWEGGAYNELNDFNREYNQYEENIEDVNKILQSQDFPSRVKSMVAHTFLESQKSDAANSDDMKAWKDADDKQAIHDIQSFLRAGKLEDLRAIYDELGADLSDDDVENIVKSTTKEITAEEDKQNFDRNIDEQIASHQRRITDLQAQAQDIGDSQETLGINERTDYQAAVTPALENIFQQIDDEYAAIDVLNQQKQDYVGQKYYEGAYVDRQGNRTSTNDEIKQAVKHNSEELNRKLDSYLESIDYVNRRTGGQLTKDQEDNLAYLHNLGKESNVRMQKIMADVRKQLPSKFLLKTSKTPEQLTKENVSSDLAFSKDENTKEGYVEVDTSAMNDAAFADFFQREVMRGGNINPEFSETADEKAAREEEEKNLPETERKKKARQRASKKWKDAIQKMQDDANEQWDTNWRNLVDNFMDNYKKNGNATLDETVEAFGKVRQNLQDASDLFDQAGEFQKTLMEYMQNPSKVDEARQNEEQKADKANQEQQAKNKFAGKTAKQLNQELAEGSLDLDEFDDFAGADLSDVSDDDVKAAQTEVKKAQETRQVGAAIKNHIQEQLGDNPTQDELNAAQMAMQMVDQATLAADNPEDISIDMPELSQIPLDAVDPNTTLEDVDNLNQQVQDMLADAFTAAQEDISARDMIPEEPSIDDVPEAVGEGVSLDTGHDPVTKTKPEVKAPDIPVPSKAAKVKAPKNPITESALDTIIQGMQKVYDKPSTSGTMRTTTTRNTYGRSTGTYHESVAKPTFGENSVEYKRSKAIWEHHNQQGVFDRQDNVSADRIKVGDTIHLAVKNLANGVYGKNYSDLTDEEKPYALAIVMMNDKGEIVGDLPLAELEPSYKSGNPTQQVKDLKALQDKIFKAYNEHLAKATSNDAIIDGTLQVDGYDNLGLTFDGGKKKPLVSKVKQTMRGVVPFTKSEKNTLNDVSGGNPFELGVAVTGTTIAKKRGDKTQHKEIVAPRVGTVGQPYLLLPTTSGEQMAVPFYMPAFNADQHRNTELYRLLSNALFYMLTTNGNSKENIDAFGKHMDVIEGLLQVERQEGRKKVMEIDTKNNQVTLHLQSLTDGSPKEVTVPYTDNFAEMAKLLADGLSGTPINVSLQYLNDKIETGISNGEKYTRDYNKVIGEIADVNLPKNTTHTVNNWFTIELAPSSTKGQKRNQIAPRTTGTYTVNIGGRNVEIDTDKLIAVDTATGEIIEDDENINLLLAQTKASKPQYKDKDRIQVSIGGELRTYDVKEGKFVKNKPIEKSPKETLIDKINKAVSSQELVAISKELSNQDNGLSADDVISLTGMINQKRVSLISETPDISGVTPPASGGASLGNLQTPFAVGDKVWIPATTSDKTDTSIAPFIKDGRIEATVTGVFNDGDISVQYGKNNSVHAQVRADKVSRQPIPSAPAQKGKTIEQVEDEMKQKKVVGRQTKAAWDAIPQDKKLRMANEGAAVTLKYNGKSVTVSMDNLQMLTKALKDANDVALDGNLEILDAVKPMEKNGSAVLRENEQAARRWLAKNIPSLSSEERTQFVDRLSRAGADAERMWGSYRGGVLQIQRNAPMGTVYHEAFHYVMDMVLSPEEKNELINVARQEYGINLSDYAVEERLANDFRRYAMDENATGISGRILKWLRIMKDRITRYNRISDTTINQLFWKINNGELANRALQAENFEQNQQNVLREIRNIQKEKLSWRNLDAFTREALKSSGLSEAAYDQMSLEEKQQYVKCRG